MAVDQLFREYPKEMHTGGKQIHGRPRYALSGGSSGQFRVYRKQAQVLAGLTLSTSDNKKAERMKLRAMEHLAAAELLDLVGALGADVPLAPRLLSEPAIGRLGTSPEEGRHGFAVSELKGTSRI